MICEELKIACTIQMRRFDTLMPALDDNRGDAVIASIAVTPETRQRVDFSDPYYRTPARFVARARLAIDDVRPEPLEGKKVAVVAGTAHEAYLKALFTEAERPALIRTPRRRARRCARARSICCSATASRSRSGSTAPIRRIAARSAAGRSSTAAISAKASASRSSAATTRCGWRSTGRCSGCGRRAASPICGCAISRSARFDLTHQRAIDATGGGSYEQRPSGEHACPSAETAASLRELAEQSNAWPFEEARKIVARLKKQAEGRGDLRDRLRPLRACRISARSARSRAPPWCATPSACSPTTRSRRG